MQNIPEEERPDIPAARLRPNRPHINYRASIARSNLDDNGNGHILLISGEEGAQACADPKTRKEAMLDDPDGWAAGTEAKELDNHKKNDSFE